MASVKVSPVDLHLLSDGQLANLALWNEQIAEAMADREGLKLTDAHWEIIHLIRDYYRQFHISPIRKLLKQRIAKVLGPGKAADQHLRTLFPEGIMTQGMRLSGVPIPVLDAEVERSAQLTGKIPDPNQAIHYVSEFEYMGRIIKVYSTGNLVHLDDWSEGVAIHMANKEGLTLSKEHWEIIRFLRYFYFEYGIAPMVRLLIKHIEETLSPEKAKLEYLYKLFPRGPSKQGSRIAGLPEPQGCIEE